MSNEQNFVGGSVVGVDGESAPAKKARQRRESAVRHEAAAITGVDKKTVVKVSGSFTDPLNPDSEIISAGWGRPIEINPNGLKWEAKKGIVRRFKTGDVLWLITNQDVNYHQTYIMQANPRKVVDAVSKKLPHRPYMTKETTAQVPGFKYHVEIVPGSAQAAPKTYTQGLCPLYTVVVKDGPAAGLRLLCYPSDLMDDEGLDGYGSDVVTRRKKEGFDMPKGFTLKENA